MQKKITLILVLILIVGAIYFLESSRQNPNGEADVVQVPPSAGMGEEEKAKMFPVAKEITTPDAFINVDDVTVEEHIGKNVILVDFWTYSCINCQRTLPYLNAWHEKYSDKGLVILGIHTPEFEFEKELENVRAAVEKYDIEYPVVLDNDFSTWRAYRNRYWPRKYLIDIDGYIVYDHIGEGGYEETERHIQAALKERNEKLGMKEEVASDIAQVTAEAPARTNSPEVYFGAARNELLANGTAFSVETQQLQVPDAIKRNQLYLGGTWRTEEEYATNYSKNARIVFKYQASKIFMVASSEEPIDVILKLDGKSLGNAAGESVVKRNGQDIVTIQEDGLYRLVEDPAGFNEHTIEIIIPKEGLKAFTFTFG